MRNKTFVAVSAILLVVAAVAIAAYLPARIDITSRRKVADFPMRIGEWSGKEIPLSERDYQILETRNLFVREYTNTAGQKVYLYLVYSEDNRKVSHPPEVCMLGSGATIVDKVPLRMDRQCIATKLIVEKGTERQVFVYWYKAGTLQTNQYLRQQLKVVLDRIMGKRTAGALIRISADIKADNQKSALQLIAAFYRQIVPLLPRYVP